MEPPTRWNHENSRFSIPPTSPASSLRCVISTSISATKYENLASHGKKIKKVSFIFYMDKKSFWRYIDKKKLWT
jgi:hypothetical protein